MENTKSIGLTKDVGFQFGIRKTFVISTEQAWSFLFSDVGMAVWLGELETGNLTLKSNFKTKEGITGMIRVIHPGSHFRMSWKKPEWSNTSTLQIRILPAKNGTTISIHQEKLLDENQRKEMKDRWEAVMNKLGGEL